MTQDPLILLIAHPGSLRDSLRVLLTTISGSQPVIRANDGSEENLSAINGYPDLVLVVLEPDIAGTEENTDVTQIKIRWPQTRLVVLVDSEEQRQAITSTGVDRVWFTGTLAAQMLVEIEALLNE
jgi:DNA-binding NarL/FixJ family response regulator